MSSRPAGDFLEYMVANIDEDTPRLAYADWLQEQGHEERAEFVRVQVSRARLPIWDAEQVRLRVREAQLLKRFGESWLAEMPKVEGARWEGFRRGVVAEVSFASFEAMRAVAAACRAVAPVEAVTVRWPRQPEPPRGAHGIAELRELSLTGRPASLEEVLWLANSPQLSTLRALTARGLWVDALRRLLESPHLANLRAFRLPSNNLGNAGISVLTRSKGLGSLEELVLAGQLYDRYGDDPTVQAAGMQALAAWPGLAGVRALRVTGSDAGRPGLRALLRSPHVQKLKSLALRAGRLDGQALAEFGEATGKLTLDALDLGENLLKDVGAENLALAKCLNGLKSLVLDRCELRFSGAKLLAQKAKFMKSLRVLNVAENHYGSGGVEALMERAPPALHTLDLRDSGMNDEAVTLLADSPASDTLHELDLSRNSLGARAARALAAADHLKELHVLRLSQNAFDPAARAELRDSPLGKRLGLLEFETEPPAPKSPPEPPPPPIPFDDGDPIPF